MFYFDDYDIEDFDDYAIEELTKIVKKLKHIAREYQFGSEEFSFFVDLGDRIEKPIRIRKDNKMIEEMNKEMNFETQEDFTRKINGLILQGKDQGFSTKDISDKWHTFGDLYYHRMILTYMVLKNYPNLSWKSKQHHDETMFDDSFIVGIDTPKGQYSYHYNLEYWDLFDIRELDKAPVYDGHKPEDIGRLLSLLEEEYKMNDKTFEELKTKVEEWAKDKDLLHSENADKQFMKFIEEVFEFKSEMDLIHILGGNELNSHDMMLEMGDIFVTLIILCEQLEIDPVVCLEMAYKKISKRKGVTKDGIFIKEEDL